VFTETACTYDWTFTHTTFPSTAYSKTSNLRGGLCIFIFIVLCSKCKIQLDSVQRGISMYCKHYSIMDYMFLLVCKMSQ
jgi:hypothetical protein